ncbi:hypothetical protein, partial [EBPR siphovirus 5]
GRILELRDILQTAEARADCLRRAHGWTRAALCEANHMRDRKRAGLCLKALHWIRLAIAA